MSERYHVVEDPCGVFFIWDEWRLEAVMSDEDVLAFVAFSAARREASRLNARVSDKLLGWDSLCAGRRLAVNHRSQMLRHDVFLA